MQTPFSAGGRERKLLGSLSLAALAAAVTLSTVAQGNHVTPVVVDENPMTCQKVFDGNPGPNKPINEFKIERPLTGLTTGTKEHTAGPTLPNGQKFKVDITQIHLNADGEQAGIDFANANWGVDAVIMKGGNQGANVYLYNPDVRSDTGLFTPPNTGSNKPAQISFVAFCYDLVDTSVTTTTAPPPPPPPPPGAAPTPPRARDTTAPRIRLAIRQPCVSRSQRLGVRVRETNLRRVKAYIDGKLVLTTTRRSFSVPVPDGLRAGRHRLTVIALDRAGNRRRTTRRFSVCAAKRRAVKRRAPQFTG